MTAGRAAAAWSLQPDGEVAGEQAEADRDPIGVQAGADQMIEIMAMDQFVDSLLDAPALAVQRGQALGAQPLHTGDVDPGPPPSVGVRAVSASSCKRASQAHHPRRMAPCLLQPAALLAGERGQAGPDGAVRAKPRMKGMRAASSAATAARLVKPQSATTPARRRPSSRRTCRASTAVSR